MVGIVFMVIVGVFLAGSYRYGAVFIIIGRYLSVAVRCQRRFRRHISTGSYRSINISAQSLSVHRVIRYKL